MASLPSCPLCLVRAGGGTPEGSEAGEGSVLLPDDDRQLIRQELLLGHLLTLAASSGALPPHALPSIAAMLQVGRAGWGAGGAWMRAGLQQCGTKRARCQCAQPWH